MGVSWSIFQLAKSRNTELKNIFPTMPIHRYSDRLSLLRALRLLLREAWVTSLNHTRLRLVSGDNSQIRKGEDHAVRAAWLACIKGLHLPGATSSPSSRGVNVNGLIMTNGSSLAGFSPFSPSPPHPPTERIDWMLRNSTMVSAAHKQAHTYVKKRYVHSCNALPQSYARLEKARKVSKGENKVKEKGIDTL